MEGEPSAVGGSEHLAFPICIQEEGNRFVLWMGCNALQVNADIGQIQAIGWIDFNVAGGYKVALLNALSVKIRLRYLILGLLISSPYLLYRARQS